MNIEDMLQQMEMYNASYEWAVRESEKIAKCIAKLNAQTNFDADRYHACTTKLMELQLRYARNKRNYNALLHQARQYFCDNHGIDIMSILNDADS